ncbi:MAG: alpha/beta hydrolase [Oscillospiraceae bacterium]|jgi:pimeloyl-ACP methyl ester carboxylesterase|nr:alpha/beta hydrolase [Oscillospiraceae bacterium]
MQYDRVERVPLGGFRQKIHILGQAAENPVLLFLHGGPGIPDRGGLMERHRALAKDFTIVAWDQRGTGGSYRGVDPATLTVDRLVEDAAELAAYLCRTLGREKIFICGGSWGTELGTFLAHRHPEHIAAYVGSGQVVNGVRNEELSYSFCVRAAREAGDARALAVLEKVGPPVRGQYAGGFDGLMAQRNILKKYGGHSLKNRGGFFRTYAKPILRSKEYTPGDVWGILRGYKLTLSTMWPTVVDYDFVHSRNTFAMPYFIFQGRHDQNTPSDLIEEYFAAIQAPRKELIWFEQSAHGPMVEEKDTFYRLLREKLLA